MLNQAWTKLFSVHAVIFFLLPIASAEPHEPIVISSTSDMLLPDLISGNGVREGVGTAADPWVISDWSIRVKQGQPAITILNVAGYVRLEDIDVEVVSQDNAQDAAAIILNSVASASINGVALGGPAMGLSITKTEANVSDLLLDSWTEGTCIGAKSSTLNLQRLEVSKPCGWGLLALDNVAFQGIDVNAAVYSGIGVIGEGSFSLRDSFLESLPHARGKDGNVRNAQTIIIDAEQQESVNLSNVTLVGALHACLHINGSDSSIEINFEGKLLSCGRDGDGAGIRIEDLARGVLNVRSSEFVNNSVGVLAHKSNINIDRGLFFQNQRALAAWDHASIDASSNFIVSSSTFAGNQIDLDMGADSVANVRQSWFESRVSKGNVDVDGGVGEPPIPIPAGKLEESAGTVGNWGLLVVLVTGALCRRYKC